MRKRRWDFFNFHLCSKRNALRNNCGLRPHRWLQDFSQLTELVSICIKVGIYIYLNLIILWLQTEISWNYGLKYKAFKMCIPIHLLMNSRKAGKGYWLFRPFVHFFVLPLVRLFVCLNPFIRALLRQGSDNALISFLCSKPFKVLWLFRNEVRLKKNCKQEIHWLM